MSHLSVETSRSGPVAVLVLTGELDLAGAGLLEQELERAVTDAEAVVVDLRQVTFMDSSGLRMIALASERAQESGRRFGLVPGAAQVMRVFDITRMRERLRFLDDPGRVMEEP